MENFEQIKQNLPVIKEKLLDLSKKRRSAIESENKGALLEILKEEEEHIEKLLQQIKHFMKFYKTMKKFAGGKLKKFEGLHNEFKVDLNFMEEKKELISKTIKIFKEDNVVDFKVFNENMESLEEKYSSLRKYTTEEIEEIEKNVTN